MSGITRELKTGVRAKLFLGVMLAGLVVFLFPPRAAAVECVGDRTYETAVADGCSSISGNLVHRCCIFFHLFVLVHLEFTLDSPGGPGTNSSIFGI